MGILLGAIMVIVGVMVFSVPVIGWIMGPILIIMGIFSFFGDIIGIIFGIIGGFFSLLFGGSDGDDYENKRSTTESTKESVAEELTKLSQLDKDGILTEEEFKLQKEAVLQKT